ncbi:SgrR family transcriptional regulator [Bacillus carboniphilus]|uniref:SgrR family transcriptional regulator n=1 Tax=Bacillus carboniphilus TaxID=86663 RepID=A0ABY9JRK0_9BACI|nr:ABC transporter substrate-binding protein [Bacillus carboniphilus]WLR41444.1 SgrR family transcriptional regulator [Bacillus carboniphilus]
MVDNKLLTLWNCFSSGNIRMEEVSETLQISQKQTTRLLKKWEKEGWLTYSPGRGRGKVSSIVWKTNIEEHYEEKTMDLIKTEPVEKSSKYLMFSWSAESKRRLMNQFQKKLGYVQESKDKLIVPRRYSFFAIEPLEATDAHSAHLIANVFNCLVSITPEGKILPEIAHSWEVSFEKHRFYLKKDIRFHDGSILSADEIVNSLERVRAHRHYKDLWSPIEQIVAKTPLVVDIYHPSGCSYLLPLLSTMNASIYKKNKGRLIGTGCFSIEENSESITTLIAFTEHFMERPLLDSIEFVKVPDDFKTIYHTSIEQLDEEEIFQVKSDSDFGVVIMNLCRDSIIQKEEVRNYLHYLIAKNRDTLPMYDPRVLPNHQSCLIGQGNHYTIQEVEPVAFDQPIVIRGTNYTASTTQWLKEMLENEGVPVEVVWFSFEESVTNHPKHQEVDLFIHGEIFEINQNFSFYYFLKNGFSPLFSIIQGDEKIRSQIDQYQLTPFKEWATLNKKVETELINRSVMIPLYYAKRYAPFSKDIKNIKIKHFGYADFSKLWVRPTIDS